LVSLVMELFFLLANNVRLFKLYAVLINYYMAVPCMILVDESNYVLFYDCLHVACNY